MRSWLTSLLLLLATCGLAAGQEDPEPKPPAQVLVRPGTGPQIPFDEGRWEFWWYFNRERYLRLRPSLARAADSGEVESDEPFRAVSQSDRQDSVVPLLVSMFKDSNPQVRAAVAQALAKTQDEGARPVMRRPLRDTHFQVRLSAIIGLGVFGNTYFLPQLEEMLGEADRELQERVFAATAIGLIGGPRVAESLRQLLGTNAFRTHPTQVQGALAYAVGITRDPENAPLLRSLLQDTSITDFQVRAYLTLSLGKCGDEVDVPTLIDLLGNPETQVRRSAAIALGVLCREHRDEEPLGHAVEALTRTIRKEADLMVRNYAYIALGQIGGQEVAKLLRAELEGVTKVHRPFVALALGILGDPESVPVLLAQFERESELSYRGALAVAIGLHRDARAATDLRKAFRDQLEPVFRGYVALALGLVRDAESIQYLEPVFAKANDVELIPNAATALGLLGSRASVATLIKRAEGESNEFVKQSLIYSLGLIGDRSAIGALQHEIEDEHQPPFVREYAVIALGQLADPQPMRGIARITVDSNYTIVSDFLRNLFFIP